MAIMFVVCVLILLMLEGLYQSDNLACQAWQASGKICIRWISKVGKTMAQNP